MTFATTYALILPAITVEKDNTAEVAGMYLEQETDRNDLLEENALEPAGANIDAGDFEYTDDEVTDAEIPDYDDIQEEDGDVESALPVKTMQAVGSDYTVTLTYDETSGIPEGAELAVSEIAQDSEEYQTYLEEAKKAMGLTEEETLPQYAARFFDIKIMVDELEFTPETGVSVEITYAEPLAEHPDTEVNAVHFADEASEAEVIAANTTEIQKDGTATVEFTAESFSVYGVIYTVDFHYEVNGKMYEFSIPGGGFASFYKIVEVLGIGEQGTQSGSEGKNEAENSEIEAGNGEDTDRNAVHNVVEEAGIEDTDTYNDAISLDSVEVSDATRQFVADVASVEFSSPELVWVGKVDEETTVGGLKEANGLEVQYSAELTEEQIAEINSSTVEAGDWALVSVQPFTSEESLTVTMKNGDRFVVKVTDAQPAATNMSQFDYGNTNRFVIWGSANGRNYVLKTDGTTEEFDPNTIDTLGAEYLWSIEYGWRQGWDYDLRTWDYRYRIRPANDHTKYLTLTNDGSGYIAPGDGLVETAECGIRLYPPYSSHKNQQNNNYTSSNAGWIVEGWGWMRLNLGTATGSNKFEGNNLYCSDINISRQQVPYTYDIIISTDDNERGGVSGYDKNGVNRQVEETFTATTESTSSLTKRNLREIKAVPTTQKWAFDYWDLDGRKLYWDTAQNRIVFEENQNTVVYTNLNGERASVINAYSLPVSFNKSKLTAHFKRNPEYEAPDDDKDGRPIDATIADWLERLLDADFPLNKAGTEKTAEVYDYENRIYRVDITAKSNLYALANTVKLGFIMDVSLSMEFPSQLDMVDKNNKSGTTTNKNNQLKLTLCNINNSSTNKQWLDQSKTYYIIADPEGNMNGGGTATVDKIVYRYVNNSWDWYWKDASKGDSAYKKIDTNTKFHSNDGTGLTYPIYMAGDLVTEEDLAGDDGDLLRNLGLSIGMPKTRRFYLQKSMASTINTLQQIMNKLSVANNVSDSKDVLIAWNTFHGSIADSDHTFKSPANVSISYAYDGGTSTQLALNDARDFGWGSDSDTTRIAILITDGAPQKSGNAISNETVDGYATSLKNRGTQTTADDITLVTLGLSMGDVRRGEILLYDIASRDKENVPYYYEAESGNELELALAEIIKLAMANAIVEGNVTDTVNEAFYPVDKLTGLPLENGYVINLDGELIALRESALTQAQKSAGYGVVSESNGTYSVTWTGQEFSWDGWRGTIYEKAKEDFLGGNAVRTNDPDHEAVVTSTGYKLHQGDTAIPFKAEIKTAGTKSMETPRVNVNELKITENSTQWTVYLGTTVKPLDQIKALYNKIKVMQVITKGTDTDRDGFKDKETWNWNAPDYEHYPLYYDVAESASDSRENETYGQQEFFYLSELIKKINNGNDIDWTRLIELSEKTGDENTGITFPYDLYGQDNPGWITIKLKKDHSVDPHATDQVGTPVETYTLETFFSPLYDHTPVGLGGDGLYPYHTGNFGLSTYGNAPGTEDNENVHTINVFAKDLEIQKKDMTNTSTLIDTAKFKLYRTAKKVLDPNTGQETNEYEAGTVDLKVGSEIKKVVQIGDEMTTSGGKITVQDLSYAPDGVYYLEETQAPDGYIISESPLTIRLTLKDEYRDYEVPKPVITDISNTPYNWTQTVQKLAYADSKDGTGDDDKFVVEVLNNPGVVLPSTGGPGTNLIYLFGIMLTGLAGAGLLMRKRRALQ